jgi:hypothetical protein
MNTRKQHDARLSEIRGFLIGAVHESLQDPDQRKKASLLNVALSLIKTAGGLDAPLSPEEAERVAAMRTALVDPQTGEKLTLPFLNPVSSERFDDEDEDEQAETDF